MNRWTKYAKQDIFNSKVGVNDNAELQCAQISRKMLSLALKCKPSKEVLRHLDNGIDKLASEVFELLSKVSVDENEETRCYAELPQMLIKHGYHFEPLNGKKAQCRNGQKMHWKHQRKEKIRLHQRKEEVRLHQRKVGLLFISLGSSSFPSYTKIT